MPGPRKRKQWILKFIYNSTISSIFVAFPRGLESRGPVKPGLCLDNPKRGRHKIPLFPVEILQGLLWLSPTVVKNDREETRHVTAVDGCSNCGNVPCILRTVFIALIMTYDRHQKIVSYHHSADSLSFSMCPGHDHAGFTGTDMEGSICCFP